MIQMRTTKSGECKQHWRDQDVETGNTIDVRKTEIKFHKYIEIRRILRDDGQSITKSASNTPSKSGHFQELTIVMMRTVQ